MRARPKRPCRSFGPFNHGHPIDKHRLATFDNHTPIHDHGVNVAPLRRMHKRAQNIGQGAQMRTSEIKDDQISPF